LVVSPASDQPIGSCWDRLLLGSTVGSITCNRVVMIQSTVS
jgi:hypothetical protein